MRVQTGLPGSVAQPVDFGLQPTGLLLQFQHTTHPGEVEPAGHERDDLLQPLDVVWAVAPGAASRPGRVQQPLALVDAKRLWMHPGQLGRYRDGEQAAARL